MGYMRDKIGDAAMLEQLAEECAELGQAAIDALEKVAELFPWRVPGNRDTYDRYNEAWNRRA